MTSPVAVIAGSCHGLTLGRPLRALLVAMITPTRAEDGCRSYDIYERRRRRAGAFEQFAAAASRSTSFSCALSELPGWSVY